MEKATESLFKVALSLPEADRADLAGALLRSLEPESESRVEEAWRLEIESRIAALDSGQVETISWETIRERLWARLSDRRPV